MNTKLIHSFALTNEPSPHIRSKRTSKGIMMHVLIALCFPAAAAVYFFGYRVLLMLVVGIGSAMLFEWIYQKIRNKKTTVADASAAVTGMLLALSLPVSAPLWTLVLGTAFAVIVVKQIGGGLGRNMFNPAVSARVMLKVFFTPWITNWVLPGVDAVSTATPLEFIGHGARTVSAEVPSLMNLFLGVDLGGNSGETAKLMILIGMLYLIFFRVISPKIPLLCMGSTALVMFLFSGFNIHFTAAHVLSGTLIFAAVFMVTDYSSGPITAKGQTIFAIGCGVLTAFFRIVFNLPGGIGFAIIIMNMVAPWLDKQFTPRIYGHKKALRVRGDREKEK
ncbi:MAG: RnfABCDGE type electron transport complex subunit D [Bacteroidia bacterium]|nr:RnfABCDGE type electron transport complex subunit D [Bacteroidia bacterium]